MKAITAVSVVLLTLVQKSLGNLDVITLRSHGDAWIQEASATLVLGETPNPPAGDLALWGAITMDKGDFLQGVTENAANSPYCSNIGRNWCNFAYALVSQNGVKNGSPRAASPGSRIKTHYKLNPGTNMGDQDLYIDGALVSSISTSQGMHGTVFYISLECAAGTCNPAPAHSWEDISIILNKADPSFIHTGSWQYKATGGVMSTPDSGKTWNFTALQIPTTSVPRS